ncbi:DNA polymerase III subunit delta' [soil metagenome]
MNQAVPPVIASVPGQDQATLFLAGATERPHHAYLLTGPEGSGKRLGMRAFAAALLCADGGCGSCRSCRLALGERHPNMLVLEPTGPDILVGRDASDFNTARWLAGRAHLTAPEPGRKLMVVIQADRLRIEAADVLLKVLEEPPPDTIFLLLSARPDEIPDTVRSRCQEVAFPPLTEEFAVGTLVGEGIPEDRARLACRLAGGNLGRARRLARDEGGLGFRDHVLDAARRAQDGPAGALAAAEAMASAAKEFKAGLGSELEAELEPMLDERGKPDEAFRGVIRRMQDAHDRRVRRAEREFYDWSLLALATFFRDASLLAAGGDEELVINLDLREELARQGWSAGDGARALAHVEEARADLADETNLNPRLILERLFLRLSSLGAARTASVQ